MPLTYDPIATTTANGSISSVTFSSIPSTFTDLIIVAVTSYPVNAINTDIKFNNDSGSNYSTTWLLGTGSSALSGRFTNAGGIGSGFIATAGQRDVSIIQLQNYASNNVFKSVLTRSNNAGDRVEAGVHLWRNTNAITTITLAAAATWVSGSTFTLYGIKAA